ncbi:sodium-coupled monocarboxylate transporter 1-like [Monodelphis domestica]|uniref:sodium-coupled monocarboxylate transporter 1-like n=1 Tax=Monodelphis domestica TaxID=13616 RepID=UPI0024E19C51|nr:sodium-coupled monocarboxylate transporter 1-like [Monodelphis domestica]
MGGRDIFTGWDYLVFAFPLVFLAIVGIYFALTEHYESDENFLLAGRQMTGYPVSMSLIVSFLSSVTMLSLPVEVYLYGAKFFNLVFGYAVVTFISGELFLPLFYRLDITSTYEYLELRFSKRVRLVGSFLFIIQMLIYTGIVIYGPSFALSQVIGFELWTQIITTGILCTFYCSLGGLKAVIWTDAFQFLVILAGFISILAQSIIAQGGLSTILNHADIGGRLDVWDFNPSPFQNYTFWTISLGGGFTWISIYGINHAQVQRYLCCKSKNHAKMALYLNLLGLWTIVCTAVLCGLSMYSIFRVCDPLTAERVKEPNQLILYLAVDVLNDYPGLPGLFVAAIYSGTLSTVSSSINALSVVAIEDLIKPYLAPSQRTLYLISKVICLFFGILCVGLASVASLMGSLVQAAIKVFGLIGGPLVGLFFLGILNPYANSKGSLLGLLTGFITLLWIGLGKKHYAEHESKPKSLNLSIANCSFARSTHLNFTSYSELSLTEKWQPSHGDHAPRGDPESLPVVLRYVYSISDLYLSPLGTLVTFLVGSCISALTGGMNQDIDRKYLIHTYDTMFGRPDFNKEEISKLKDDGILQEALRQSTIPLDPNAVVLETGEEGEQKKGEDSSTRKLSVAENTQEETEVVSPTRKLSTDYIEEEEESEDSSTRKLIIAEQEKEEEKKRLSENESQSTQDSMQHYTLQEDWLTRKLSVAESTQEEKEEDLITRKLSAVESTKLEEEEDSSTRKLSVAESTQEEAEEDSITRKLSAVESTKLEEEEDSSTRKLSVAESTQEEAEEDSTSRKFSVAKSTEEEKEEDLTTRKLSVAESTQGEAEEDLTTRKLSVAESTEEQTEEDSTTRKLSVAESTQGETEEDSTTRKLSVAESTQEETEEDSTTRKLSVAESTQEETDVSRTNKNKMEDLTTRKLSVAESTQEEAEEELTTRKLSVAESTQEETEEDLTTRKLSVAESTQEEAEEDSTTRKLSVAESTQEEAEEESTTRKLSFAESTQEEAEEDSTTRKLSVAESTQEEAEEDSSTRKLSVAESTQEEKEEDSSTRKLTVAESTQEETEEDSSSRKLSAAESTQEEKEVSRSNSHKLECREDTFGQLFYKVATHSLSLNYHSTELLGSR